MRQTWILITLSILFVIGTTIMFSTLWYAILMLWIWKKSFLPTIFHVIKVHPSNATNLDTHINLYSFCYWHNNHVLHFGLHDIDLWICKKSILSTIVLIIKFIHEMRQTWIPITISILLVIGIAIMFSIMGCTILMLWIWRKSFLSTIFPIIKVLPWNETNLDTHNNLQSFSYWHDNHVLLIGIYDTDALDLQEKLFFHHFPWSQSSSTTWDKLGYP